IASNHIPDYMRFRHDYGNYPIVFVSTTVSGTPDRVLVPPEVLAWTIEAYHGVQRSKIALVNYFVMGESPEAGLQVHTSNPWKIYLQPLGDLHTQLENVKLLLKKNHPTEYVDVRFGDRLYWK